MHFVGARRSWETLGGASKSQEEMGRIRKEPREIRSGQVQCVIDLSPCTPARRSQERHKERPGYCLFQYSGLSMNPETAFVNINGIVHESCIPVCSVFRILHEFPILAFSEFWTLQESQILAFSVFRILRESRILAFSIFLADSTIVPGTLVRLIEAGYGLLRAEKVRLSEVGEGGYRKSRRGVKMREASGAFWQPLGASGPSGSFWEHLGASGSLWEFLGACGSL